MICKLCNKPIVNYSPEFHHLKLDEVNSCDICSECIDKVTNWQGNIIAKLFPSKIMKKRFDKK